MADPQPVPDAPLAVRTRALARRLGGAWALKGVDLDVPVGRAVMLFGPNGAGKTTLVRVLSTALRPSHGTLELFGGPPREARPRVGLLSHADNHYDDLSARENLRLGCRLAPSLDPARIPGILDRVGLGARADDAVGSFSAGMRKRLAFGRLLLKAPPLVLLDEPYAQLDPDGHRFVDGLLRDWVAAGVTVLVSTHQVARVSTLCHDAVRLEGGRVSWTGPAAHAPERAERSADA